ncbi:MAG: leucine-rich repeat domain-containing protein [Saprospiraceae bacterium]|nr:leucine-rich repeat domain-containing protein [Lewinella sp.]
MQFIVKTTPEELQRARKWWKDLESQWKMAYNEAVFGVGPTLEPPHDDALMILLIQADTLRFAGPLAIKPNITTPLTNLSGLIPLYHLTYLSITNMHFTSVRELSRFTKMKHLFLYENRIESLTGIDQMVDLVDLYVQNNCITDLSPLRNLTNIQTLYVSKNKLQKINGLTEKHADKMKRFYVQPNDELPDREIIRTQNELGIICRMG